MAYFDKTEQAAIRWMVEEIFLPLIRKTMCLQILGEIQKNKEKNNNELKQYLSNFLYAATTEDIYFLLNELLIQNSILLEGEELNFYMDEMFKVFNAVREKIVFLISKGDYALIRVLSMD